MSHVDVHTLPGSNERSGATSERLRYWLIDAGGLTPRVTRTHYGSLGAPDREQKRLRPIEKMHSSRVFDNRPVFGCSLLHFCKTEKSDDDEIESHDVIQQPGND